MKETIEEVAERFSNTYAGDEVAPAYEGFIEGAKWQQEQVIQLLKDNDYENEAVFDFLTEEFFNQNKKK